MAGSTAVPSLISSKKSTKEEIIRLLAERSPLSLKDAYNFITKNFDRTISYQAVHKSLTQLESEGVVTKVGKDYLLNDKWLNNLSRFVNKATMGPNSVISAVLGKDYVHLSFNCFFDFTQAMLYLFSSDVLYEGVNHVSGGGMLKHLWWPLSFRGEEHDMFKKMLGERDSYIAGQYDTVVDRWLCDYYKKAGCKGIRLGVGGELDDDLVWVGDSVITVYFPNEVKNFIHETYSNATSISDLINNEFLQETLTRPCKIHVIINKNPEIAAIVRKRTIDYVGGANT